MAAAAVLRQSENGDLACLTIDNNVLFCAIFLASQKVFILFYRAYIRCDGGVAVLAPFCFGNPLMNQGPSRLRYRVLTGFDDRSLCLRVSKALEDGYVLYGSPSIVSVSDRIYVAQAVVLPSVAETGSK